MSNRSDRSSRTIHVAAILDAHLPIVATRSDPDVCQRGHPRATYWTVGSSGKGRCRECCRLTEAVRRVYLPKPDPRPAPVLTRDEELAKLGAQQQRDQVYGWRVYGARVTPSDTGEERPKW